MQHFERDHERLQQAVEKLEGELATARQAQDALDDQKQENVRVQPLAFPVYSLPDVPLV